MPTPRKTLKRQFWVRLGLDALGRRETVLAAAGGAAAVVASRLPPLIDRLPTISWVVILAFGTAVTLWVLWEALRDGFRQARIVSDVLSANAGPENLEDVDLQATVRRAVETRRHIGDLLHSLDRDGTMPRGLLPGLDGWLRHFVALAARLDALKRELSFVIERSVAAKARMDAVERRLGDERDPSMKGELERTLLGYRKTLEFPRDIEAMVDRATLKLEQSENLLSSVHGALVLLGTTGLETVAAQRLLEDISDDILDLDAVVASTMRLESA